MRYDFFLHLHSPEYFKKHLTLSPYTPDLHMNENQPHIQRNISNSLFLMREWKAHRHFCIGCKSILSIEFTVTIHCLIYSIHDFQRNQTKASNSCIFFMQKIRLCLQPKNQTFAFFFSFHFRKDCQLDSKNAALVSVDEIIHSSKLWFTSSYGSHGCSRNTNFCLFAVFVPSCLWHVGSLHKLHIIMESYGSLGWKDQFKTLIKGRHKHQV